VPLLTLGTQRQFGARQMWVMNLLAVAGIRTTDAPAAAPVALIASDKAGYAEFAADAVASLREAGAERVLIAGNSAQGLADTSLVDGKVAEGMDVVAFLTEILDRFGAPAAPTTKGASA
jgi:methylmalonyl-CoA mutase